MSWRVEWTPVAERSLRRIPWHDAERVDAAVQRFAKTSDGDAYRLPEDDAATVRLQVGPYRVRASFDRWGGVMHVWCVYRV